MRTPLSLRDVPAVVAPPDESGADAAVPPLDAAGVVEQVKWAAQLLPAQGPITAFVFLNTLQALEDLPFEQGLIRGGELFGCEPYLAEDRYREKLARGRIRPDDLNDTVRRDLEHRADEPVGPAGTLFDLRMALLLNPVRTGTPAELQWYLAETDALSTFRAAAPESCRRRTVEETRVWALRRLRNGEGTEHPLRGVLDEIQDPVIDRWNETRWTAFALKALWEVCRRGAADIPIPPKPTGRERLRDLMLDATGDDSDRLTHEFLIPFLAAFLDQGFSQRDLPERDGGLWKSFVALYGQVASVERWLAELPSELRRVATLSPADVIIDAMAQLGVSPDRQREFLTQELLALRGWAGMLWQAEDRGDRIARPVAAGTLVEFLAARLVVDRVALRQIARTAFGDRRDRRAGPQARPSNLPSERRAIDSDGRIADQGNRASAGPGGPAYECDAASSLSGLRTFLESRRGRQASTTPELRAFQVFHLAQLLGWSAAALDALSPVGWESLVREVESFDGLARRRVFHLAFERRFRVRALDAIALHNRGKPARRVDDPLFQSVYCIDAREESFRRHLEEVCSRAETFGAAGFFGVAMYYKGVADAHFQALCPIVVRPQHWVTEEVVYSLAAADRRLKSARKRLATASRRLHVGSRSMTAGAVLTAGFGVLASIPLVARVLFPRTTAKLRDLAGSVVSPPPVTRLRLERVAPNKGPVGDAIGYSVDEMANVGERILNEIGVRSGFARLMFFFGHGSFCLNNPHKSAYDCGACSGSAGGPNARALAEMLNDRRVRQTLADRGIEIPATTYFVGGLHNTATDSFTFHDLDRLPRSHIPDFEAAREHLELACERNSQERCRRFFSAPLDITPPDARRHVENRAEDLAQTRPEFGNASNALCVVGRRDRTRGLYLDRRSFLVSYDPTLDDEESTILGRILGAVVIVCSGINLQYFFSYIDPAGWGAGTKLPHNITSLLGVMDGAASDLRSGLPWQGVEIHEPVRLLFVIETTPAAIEKIMKRNPTVGNILRNGWVQLALLDPETAKVSLYQNGAFQPYAATVDELARKPNSRECYRGWREHCEFAEVGA